MDALHNSLAPTTGAAPAMVPKFYSWKRKEGRATRECFFFSRHATIAVHATGYLRFCYSLSARAQCFN